MITPDGSLRGEADQRLLVTAERVVTDPEQAPFERGGVLIEGRRIAAVGRAADLQAGFPGVEHRDFPAATVLPGLINVHLHLAFDVYVDDVLPLLERGDPVTLAATIAANAHTSLMSGITTCRDLGDRDGLVLDFAEQVDADAAIGPRVLSATSPLTPPRGHCWFLGGEIDTRPTGTPESDARLRRAVADRAAMGAQVIKVMASGGLMTPTGADPWDTQFTLHELEVVVDAARECGLPVAGHAHGAEAIARCARAGVDTIEHGSWRAPPAADGTARFDPRDDVAELIAASGSVVVPTNARDWHTWSQSGFDRQVAEFQWAAAHGIEMVFGNDAGVGRGLFEGPLDALTLYQAAGWSPAQALATATTRAARALGRNHDLGHLEAGYAADLVVVDGNPLADLHALRDIKLVMTRGRSFTP